MEKIFKYIFEFKWTALMIILLLIGQAYCDLSLPSYTAKLVDVGVSRDGIEYAVPTTIRAGTLESLRLFMTEEEINTVNKAYGAYESSEEIAKLDTRGIDIQPTYTLNDQSKSAMEELNGIFTLPMLIVTAIENPDRMSEMSGGENNDGGSDDAFAQIAAGGIDGIRQAYAAGYMTKEQLLSIRDKFEEFTEAMGGSMLTSLGVEIVKAEYAALGIDVGKIRTSYLWESGLKMLGMSLAMVLFAVMAGFLAARTAAKVGRNLRIRTYKKVVSFSHNEINRFSTASLITRSTNDIQQIQMVSVMLLRMVAYAPILGIGGVIKVIGTRTGMGWIIGLAVLLVLMLVGVLLVVAMPKFQKMQTLIDHINLISREILTGLLVIRAFNREKHEEGRFGEANQKLMANQLFTNRAMTFMWPVLMLIMNGITLLIIWFGGKGIDTGNIQIGDMMAFMQYTMQIIMSFLMLTMVSVMLPRAGVAANRIDEILKTEVILTDKDKVRDNELSAVKGEIRFTNVNFRYNSATEDALTDISFTAKPGETTAIIGGTGCGKSTLVHLIPRFFDVTGGSITLDGIDIRDLSQRKLRSEIGFVPQKGVLFSGDIESNIKFSGEEVSDADMKEAASIAQAEEFIGEKDGNYKSHIAQGGTNVSGGQKQRLSIARAIAKKPKIFLFDDSFSALDYKTDLALRRALRGKLKDSTVIIVAQRISTVLHADRILVMNQGRIEGSGTHAELLKSCETYREIASSQLSEAELTKGAAV